MHWAIERSDGTYSFDPATGQTERFDPATGKKERLVPFPHRRLRRQAVPRSQTSLGRVRVAARSPRRRSIRSSREKARAPGGSADLVLAVAGIDAGGASTFTELARGYELDERQRRLVHM